MNMYQEKLANIDDYVDDKHNLLKFSARNLNLFLEMILKKLGLYSDDKNKNKQALKLVGNICSQEMFDTFLETCTHNRRVKPEYIEIIEEIHFGVYIRDLDFFDFINYYVTPRRNKTFTFCNITFKFESFRIRNMTYFVFIMEDDDKNDSRTS